MIPSNVPQVCLASSNIIPELFGEPFESFVVPLTPVHYRIPRLEDTWRYRRMPTTEQIKGAGLPRIREPDNAAADIGADGLHRMTTTLLRLSLTLNLRKSMVQTIHIIAHLRSLVPALTNFLSKRFFYFFTKPNSISDYHFGL